MVQLVSKAYGNISPRNPLVKLSEGDKAYLCSLLMMYARAEATAGTSGPMSGLEQAAKTADRAEKLAREIEANLLKGEAAQVLGPVVEHFKYLPAALRSFSGIVGQYLEMIGKAGHKNRVLANWFLVMASELVQLTTGSYNDEHLAELLQSYRDEADDCSGDAIRKKREHFQKSYPDLYSHSKVMLSKEPRSRTFSG